MKPILDSDGLDERVQKAAAKTDGESIAPGRLKMKKAISISEAIELIIWEKRALKAIPANELRRV